MLTESQLARRRGYEVRSNSCGRCRSREVARRSIAGARWPIAALDLAVARLAEGHLDARAILAELGPDATYRAGRPGVSGPRSRRGCAPTRCVRLAPPRREALVLGRAGSRSGARHRDRTGRAPAVRRRSRRPRAGRRILAGDRHGGHGEPDHAVRPDRRRPTAAIGGAERLRRAPGLLARRCRRRGVLVRRRARRRGAAA